jgi:hypothetical protein
VFIQPWLQERLEKLETMMHEGSLTTEEEISSEAPPGLNLIKLFSSIAEDKVKKARPGNHLPV